MLEPRDLFLSFGAIFIGAERMMIKDLLYGSFDIKEEVLLELIDSYPVQRLKNASQHGFPKNETELTFETYSRYEHSIGVMLLLRRLNASLEEQVAGLLHDVSHTAFSHIIDWVMGDPTKGNYQDNALSDYIKKSAIAGILSKHGYDIDRISNLEDNGCFRLLESKMPDLCADRIDYALRDSHYFLGVDTSECVEDLIVDGGEIVFGSRKTAEDFAKYYARCQKEYWSGNEAMLRYYFISKALKEALEKKIITMDDLYKDESYLIVKLRKSNERGIVYSINKGLGKLNFVESNDGKIRLIRKLRCVDPKFLDGGKVRRLSEVEPEYKLLMEEERTRSSKTVRVTMLD
jgi:uncharacterized protein